MESELPKQPFFTLVQTRVKDNNRPELEPVNNKHNRASPLQRPNLQSPLFLRTHKEHERQNLAIHRAKHQPKLRLLVDDRKGRGLQS
jgi:hypothetical protein